jgi:hypothetical protein
MMELLKWLAAISKNRAIREGRWQSQHYEVQESALANAKALVDAIRGKEIEKKFRDGWDEDIVGDGSQNHPLLGAACEFWYRYHHGPPAKMHEVLDAWLTYSRLHYMTGETFSSFIYGLWIHGAILTVAFGARLIGRVDVAGRLYGILGTAYSLWALGCSGDDWTGSHPGKAVAWAGSRSWITPDDGGYYDESGVLKEPYNIDTTFATNFLAAALGWRAPGKWLADLVGAMYSVDPQEPWGLSETDKGTLRLVALSQGPMNTNSSRSSVVSSTDAFDRVIEWLEAADPLPAIPCRIVKTAEWVGFFALFSIHPFSTSFKYASLWFRSGRPSGVWWGELWPGVDGRAGWFNLDPSVRKAGVHGYLEVTDDGTAYELLGERTQGKTYNGNHIPPDVFYYELAGGHRDPGAYLPGPRVIRLPYSEKVYDVGFGPDGVEVYWPDAGNGNGEEDCSEIPNWLERIWCYIRKWLGL